MVADRDYAASPADADALAAHEFRQEDDDAINASLAARRPLLVRGEPGVGKTQLARVAARQRGWAFHHKVIDSRSEARDLKWTEDLVARLADAQMAGALKKPEEARARRKSLELRHYIRPGPLWWAFDWRSATRQAESAGDIAGGGEGDPEKGVVVLIDEIDKAEVELPNGLLEVMGAREFTPPEHPTVRARSWPLIVVTTNEERRLPDAFIRRCVVHDMRLPEEPDELEAFLAKRGKRHFPQATDTLLSSAARQTIEDRAACRERRLRPLPGQAEYLDLLRAVLKDCGDEEATLERLERLSKYFLRKHVELR